MDDKYYIIDRHICGGELTMGNNVSISAGVTIDITDNVIIEDDVIIAECTDILTHDHIPESPREIRKSPIRICKGAFIGAHVGVMERVSIIGEHSVIGYGSVVTKDIPAYEVWAGNPAKFIRKIIKDGEK